MAIDFPPSYTPLPQLTQALRLHGHAALDAAAVQALCAVDAQALEQLAASWDDLPADDYLRDGGRYRSRRHHSCIIQGGRIEPVAHRAHWQSLEYNALHGGLERWFAPVTDAVRAQPAWEALLAGLAGACDALAGPTRWFVEAHQFRIDTTDGIGRPTPEGAHRDGVDYVAVLLVGRHAIKGGETRVFEADGPRGERFMLQQPWSLLLMDDARVIHESTPIQPAQPGGHGWRDTLVLTYRKGGFQGDD